MRQIERMRNALPTLGLLTALAALATGCGYDSPPPPSYAGGGAFDERVDAAISAEDESVILLTISDPLPVKSAQLIDPAGAATEAFLIERDSDHYHGGSGIRPNIGVGVVGGSSSGVSTGVGIGFPIFSSTGDGAVRRITESRVRLRIADLAVYRANWQRYAIAVELDDGVNRRSFRMVPPAPLTE